MTLGGVVGEWTLQGPLGPFSHFLDMGQWLHVGKEAAFGLGRYRLAIAT
jgi:CRISPR-associated endoribonuclease Cas6